MEFYILGSYLAILLYAVFLEKRSFLEYMTSLAETIIKIIHIKKMHPYTLLQIFSVFLVFTSWFGIIIFLLFVADFLINEFKNKKQKIENNH